MKTWNNVICKYFHLQVSFGCMFSQYLYKNCFPQPPSPSSCVRTLPAKSISKWIVTWLILLQRMPALLLKKKSKVFKYAKWPSKWMTNESLVWDLMKLKKLKRRSLCWLLIDFIFCRLAETAVSGSPSVTWLSRKWRQSGESVRLPS